MPLAPIAAMAPSGAAHPGESGGDACPASADEPLHAWTVFTELFPPRDADGDRHRAWLARSPWPEVVFASAR